MKKLILATAVAAAFAGQAQAFTAVAVPLTGAGTPNWTAINAAGKTEGYITGSSAATPFLEEALRSECNTSVSPVYKIADSTNSAFVYVCSNAGTNANLTTPYLVMHKRDGGGSINALKNANGTLQFFVNEATAPNVTACQTGAAVVGAISNCTGGTVSLATTGQLADVGFSDVDSAQFSSASNGSVNIAGLTNTSMATEIFGVAVSLNLRNAMQTVAVAAGVLPTGCATGNSVPGALRESEACMPNLTTSQVSTLFANNGFGSWANVAYDNLDGGADLYNGTATANAAEPNGSTVHICARTPGSGTWATLNIKFENAPCNGNNDEAFVTSSVKNTIGQESADGVKVIHSMNGASDVDACLDALNNGVAEGTFTPYPTLAPSPAATGTSNSRYAIAVQGVDRNANLAKNYRFIKVDNVSPSAYNVVNGRWKLWSEMVAVSKGPLPTSPLITDIVTLIKDPLHIANLDALVGTTIAAGTGVNPGATALTGVQSWGQVSGFLGSALGASGPTSYTPSTTGGSATLLNAAFDPSRPVNPYTHATSKGTNLNHCRVPTIPNAADPANNPAEMPAFYGKY
ncbi:hypothetical protein [Methylomonas sp. AM2-LC]|uniref:hypothetical protein n=1 Tax=Methylomonas sp. AM2-LC TaxID=3153301 RepID=UPI0032676881